MPFVIRPVVGTRSPLQLRHADGGGLYPPGGILLVTVPGQKYSTFDTRAECQQAITRTVAYAAAIGLTDAPGNYQVQPWTSYRDEVAGYPVRSEDPPAPRDGGWMQ